MKGKTSRKLTEDELYHQIDALSEWTEEDAVAEERSERLWELNYENIESVKHTKKRELYDR